MNARYLLIYAAVLLLHGCGLLKNTSKEKRSAELEVLKSSQSEQLDLSRLYRETQTYTYRPDGSIARYEAKREQLDSASINRTLNTERQQQKTVELDKKSSPARIFILAGLLILLTFVALVYRKLFIRFMP